MTSSVPPRSVLAECAELIARRRVTAVWSHSLVLVVPLALAWGTAAWPATLVFAGAVLVYVLGGVLHIRWYLSRPRGEAEARTFNMVLGAQFIFMGFLYNAMFIYLHLNGVPRALDWVLLIMVAYCAGGVASFQQIRWLPIAFVLAALGPLLLFHLHVGTREGYLTATLIAVFLAFISRTATDLHRDAIARILLTRELAVAKRRAERLARTDELTGLLNRRALEERARAAIAGARRHERALSLVLIDIDHFKSVNDTHGHPAGDAALVALAHILRDEARASDVVGRIGGEEFAVLLPDTKAAAATVFAERTRLAAEALTVTYEGQELSLTISLGVAALDPEESTLAPLLGRADRALYAAKEAGRNRVELAPDALSRSE